MEKISDYIVTIRHAEGICVFSKRRFRGISRIFRDWCNMTGDGEFDLSIFSKKAVLILLEFFECLSVKEHISKTEAIEILKLAGYLQMFTEGDRDASLYDFELSEYIMGECGIFYGDHPRGIYDFDNLISVLESENFVSKSMVGKSCSSHDIPY